MTFICKNLSIIIFIEHIRKIFYLHRRKTFMSILLWTVKKGSPISPMPEIRGKTSHSCYKSKFRCLCVCVSMLVCPYVLCGYNLRNVHLTQRIILLMIYFKISLNQRNQRRYFPVIIINSILIKKI